MEGQGSVAKISHVVTFSDVTIHAERRKLRFVIIAFLALFIIVFTFAVAAMFKSTAEAERTAETANVIPPKDAEKIDASSQQMEAQV